MLMLTFLDHQLIFSATLANLVNSTQTLGLILDFSLILIFHWKTVACIMIIPPIATMVSMMMVPETPHWLANNGRIEVCKVEWIFLLEEILLFRKQTNP